MVDGIVVMLYVMMETIVVVIWCCSMHTVEDGILCGRYLGLMTRGVMVMLYVVIELPMVVVMVL